MGYIIGLVLLVIVVPLLFLMFSRRATGGGGAASRHTDRGMTVSRPSSDQPSPEPGATNQAAPGAERRLPPG